MIFNYMKMLDPGSVVREGEFATAAQSGSLPARIVAQYNKVVQGERLAPEMRADFSDRATRLYEGQRKLYESSISEAKKVAQQGGLNPERTVLYKPNIAVSRQKGLPAPGGGASAKSYVKTATNKATGERMGQLPDGRWEKIQ